MTKLSVAIAVPSLFLASNLFAQLSTTLDLAPNGYRDPNAWGGEFTAFVTGGPNFAANYNSAAQATIGGQTGFETFCVEIDEEFTPGGTYNTSIGNTIVPGGAAITIGTAYLYSQFAQGTLSGYQYQNTTPAEQQLRETDSDELQDAIWYLQGEVTSAGNHFTTGNGNGYQGGNYLYNFGGTGFNPSSDPFVNLVETMFGANATASDSHNNYGVQVLELSSAGGYNQDQLVYCPVPEPATIAAGAIPLVPLGISVLRILRRKK